MNPSPPMQLDGKSPPRPCILTVDDDRLLLSRLTAGMRRAGYQVLQAAHAQKAMELIDRHDPDMVLIDVSPPEVAGLELARYLRLHTGVPFMFLSSGEETELAQRAMEQGAIGYLVKPVQARQLVPAVEASLMRAHEIRHLRNVGTELEAALATGRQVSELLRQQLEQLVQSHTLEMAKLNRQLDNAHRHVLQSQAQARELARLAHEDPLTTLPNRHWMAGYLPAAVRRTLESGQMMALMYLDLDGFKSVNDAYGHKAGDELLRAAGLRMRAALKPTDRVARQGGDEFVLVIEQIRGRNEAAQIAQRLLDVLKQPFELSCGRQRVAASIGISLCPLDGEDADVLLMRADHAMYDAKLAGRGTYRFCTASGTEHKAKSAEATPHPLRD